MKNLLITIILIIGKSSVYAGFQICHNGNGFIVDQSSSTAICVTYSDSLTGVNEHDRVRDLFIFVPIKYIKWNLNRPEEMTLLEKTNVDQNEALRYDEMIRKESALGMNGFNSETLLIRSVVQVLLDENNLMRSWISNFKTEVSRSTSLADFKTRVATLQDLQQRTLSQAKTAILNKINSSDPIIDEKN